MRIRIHKSTSTYEHFPIRFKFYEFFLQGFKIFEIFFIVVISELLDFSVVLFEGF